LDPLPSPWQGDILTDELRPRGFEYIKNSF